MEFGVGHVSRPLIGGMRGEKRGDALCITLVSRDECGLRHVAIRSVLCLQAIAHTHSTCVIHNTQWKCLMENSAIWKQIFELELIEQKPNLHLGKGINKQPRVPLVTGVEKAEIPTC